jgi:hypothetical protein
LIYVKNGKTVSGMLSYLPSPLLRESLEKMARGEDKRYGLAQD